MRSILEAFEVAQVQMTTEYDEAVHRLKNHKYDCIFVDNMMSKKNGLMLAKYIRRSENTELRTMPIILCTAFTDLQSIINARDVGVTEILAKPVSPDQIMAKMNTAFFSPRTFIDAKVYAGPDRRRRIRDFGEQNDRRKAGIPLPAQKENAKDTALDGQTEAE
ncbi:hypothetical protein MNBD_ALPHA02-2494 [hydrothermal vent metagenome]|uniref:Response regulatory domain-containing protein n=1 Tax=hydrothermal vent metagenome TaxID=652676 RepID=A0A3B0S0Z2_9ZZZZ